MNLVIIISTLIILGIIILCYNLDRIRKCLNYVKILIKALASPYPLGKDGDSNNITLLLIIVLIFYRTYLLIISLPLPDCYLTIPYCPILTELLTLPSHLASWGVDGYTLAELVEYFKALLQTHALLETADGLCNNTGDLSHSSLPMNTYYMNENPNDNHPVIAKIKSSYNSRTFKVFTVKKGVKMTFMALDDYKDELDAFIKNPNISETQRFAATLIRMQIISAITAKDISVN